MIPDAKRRANQGTEDRISNFPRHLIDNILDRMLICDAARTCTLSKTWKNIWETYPNILLVEQFMNQLISSMKIKKRSSQNSISWSCQLDPLSSCWLHRKIFFVHSSWFAS